MNQLRINGIYRHYKGDKYIVLDVATHSETKEELVVYRALYGDNKLYARPKTMFFGRNHSRKTPPWARAKISF